MFLREAIITRLLLPLATPAGRKPLMFHSVHNTLIMISLYNSTGLNAVWHKRDIEKVGSHRFLRKKRREHSKEEGIGEENH
jgi:hypothetical protein